MFKKLLNVGKGHSSSEQQKLQQQHQQQQKHLFQLNEIRSYGFSHLCCLGYSASLSLLAVGSKQGLLRVLGQPSVEFSYQLDANSSIRQIEFIDCRQETLSATSSGNNNNQSKKSSSNSVKEAASKSSSQDPLQTSAIPSASAKLVVLTDNGQLYLFELKTVKQQNFADNTTQTDGDCCKTSPSTQLQQQQVISESPATEFTKLELVGQLSYFKFKLDDEDKSKRVTTLEVAANGLSAYVGTEGGNLYIVPLDKFEPITNNSEQQQVQSSLPNHHQAVETGTKILLNPATSQQRDTESDLTSDKKEQDNDASETKKTDDEDETQAVNLNVDEPTLDETAAIRQDDEDVKMQDESPFEMIKFDEHVAPQLPDEIKTKKQGAIESIKRHPSASASSAASSRVLLSYHRGLNVIYLVETKEVEKYFYHNQVLESSCFAAGLSGDFFYTSHNDGSYIKWDTRQGSQLKANEDFLSQLYGPYPCKPTPKLQACTGLVNDQLEDLLVFSGGMPRATYDDKNPVTIVKVDADGKDSIKVVLDLTSKVLDFVVITRPRGQLGAGAKSTGGGGGGGGKKNKHKQQQKQEQQRNNPIAVALAILAEEEFVMVDLLNSESYLEFSLPYLNCVHSSAITCNQHYSEISDELYDQLLAFNRQQLKGKASPNEWPLSGGKVIDAPEIKSHDVLLTGHEDGSVDLWDVSDLSMRHLLHLKTAQYFATSEDDLVEQKQDTITANGIQDQSSNNNHHHQDNNTTANSNNNENNDSSAAWPPMKRVGRFDPYSDDTRLAVRKLSLCPRTGTLVVAGTGGEYTHSLLFPNLVVFKALPFFVCQIQV